MFMSSFCFKCLTWLADNLIRLIFVCLPIMSDRKGGIRKRVLQSDDAPPSAAASSSSGYPRGGIRQRLSAQEADPSPKPLTPLLRDFKEDWARGKLTSPQVQKFAMSAVHSGAEGMQRAANAGTAGKHPQNLQRSLIALFGVPKGAPDFSWYDIPTKSGVVAQPFLLPHSWLSSLYHQRPALWASAIAGAEGAPAEFWQNMRSTPIVRLHPFLPADQQPMTVPLGLHGDGGSFSKQDSLFVFTVNSLVGSGTTVQKRFILTIIRKSEMIPGTLDAIMEVLAWSFNCALSGLWPDVDFAGQAVANPLSFFADRWRGALVQVRGDWEFYTSIFRFPSWNGVEEMCWICKASGRGELSYTSCGTDAAWRGTRRSHEGYIEDMAAQGKELPVLLKNVRGLRIESVMVDVLHCVDLGVAAHIVGNIFWACVQKRAWPGRGRTNSAQVQGLQAAMEQYYKDTKETVRVQGDLTVARLRTEKSWPKLKAKGAACRHLAPFALVLAQAHLEPRIAALAQLLVAFYQLISGPDMFLSDDAARRIPAVGLRICVLYSQLSADSFAAGEKAWKMNPKLHLFQHLTEWQCVQYGSPKFYSTYADEDMVGHMIECAATCHPRTLAVTALYKWLLFSFGESD